MEQKVKEWAPACLNRVPKPSPAANPHLAVNLSGMSDLLIHASIGNIYKCTRGNGCSLTGNPAASIHHTGMFYPDDEDLEVHVSNTVQNKLFIFQIFRDGLFS